MLYQFVFQPEVKENTCFPISLPKPRIKLVNHGHFGEGNTALFIGL